MELSAVELRVLGALIEKQRTTPDSYPLTTNSLLAACNQKSSRDPVMDLSASDVDAAMLSLRDQGLARTVRGDGHRTYKHRHIADEAMGLDGEEVSVLAVVMLRGPQSPGEIKTRTERYVGFDSLEAVEATLGRLASGPDPLVVDVGRAPGQSQDRWFHLLGDGEIPEPSVSESPSAGSTGTSGSRIAALENEVAGLRVLVEALYQQLGLDLPDVNDTEVDSTEVE